MEKLLTYHISLKFKGKLSQRQLDKISDAVYAAVEDELEAVRKGKMEDYGINAEINDYSIQEDHKKKHKKIDNTDEPPPTPNPNNDPPVPHRPETVGRPPGLPRLKLSDLLEKEAENIRQQEHE